jgi:hypothetical protein
MTVAPVCVALDAVRLEVDILARIHGDTQMTVLRQRVNAVIELVHEQLLQEVNPCVPSVIPSPTP